MENPKIRIESNGHITEVWIDGQKVEKATMADFEFHAEPFTVYCELEKYQIGEKGNIIIENGEPLKENMVVIYTMNNV